MKEKRWTGGAPLTKSPSLSPLCSGSPGDTEKCTTGSDHPQGREGASGGGRGVCNCQGSRGLGRALGASAWSPHAGQLLGGCGSPGMTAGPWLDGRRESLGWGGGAGHGNPIDKAALLILRGPFPHTRTAWGARPTGVGSGGGSLPPTQERRGQGSSWAGSLRRELRTSLRHQERKRTLGLPVQPR